MGCQFKNLRIAGGGALSDVWAQAYADIFKLPILQIEDPVQVTCRGVALIGLSRMGYLSQGEIPDRVKVRKTFEPNEANFAMYDKLFDQFKLILKTNRNIFNALNG